MTKEEKQLLLQDLCGRLPYRVKIKFAFNKDIENAKNLIYVSDNGPSYIHNSRMTLTEDNIKYVFNDWLDECKPYLRPMSSMTEEEEYEYHRYKNNNLEIFKQKHHEIIKTTALGFSNAIDWLNAHHFDYRGLIEKGLALEAPEGMYNENC